VSTPDSLAVRRDTVLVVETPETPLSNADLKRRASVLETLRVDA
jgi:hypothetical protein